MFGAIGGFCCDKLFIGCPAFGGWLLLESDKFWLDRLADKLVRLLKGSKLLLVVFFMSGWLMPLGIAVMSNKGVEMGDCGPNKSERLSDEEEGTVV